MCERDRKRETELSFIWSKMKTIAQEAAFQTALRNCSKEVGEKVSIYVILVKIGIHTIKQTFLQKLATHLMKVAASHKKTSP